MVPRRRKSAIDQREWDQLGSVIRNLYLEEDRTLKDVLVILRTVHNFQPSKSQLEWKLKQWHMTKNPTSTEWRHVISKIDQRLSRGKESQIYLSGIPLQPASIKRARGRHCYESAIERTLPRVEPPSPMDISVIIRTPSPEGQTRFSSSATLPWFQARQALQGLGLLMPRTIEPQHSNSLYALSVNFLVFRTTISWEITNLWSHTKRLQHIFHALTVLMPASPHWTHVSRAESLIQSFGSSSSSIDALEVLLFLISNNLIGSDERHQNDRELLMAKLLDLLQQSNGWELIATKDYQTFPLSMQSIFETIFWEAIQRPDLRAVRSLLASGFDVNLPSPTLASTYGVQGAFRAFHYAVIMNNHGLLEILSSYGADTRFETPRLMQLAWRKSGGNHVVPDERMTKIMFSNYTFRQIHEKQAQALLNHISWYGRCPSSDMAIAFFRTRLRSPASISDLIITSIRTGSVLIDELLSNHEININAPNSFAETPIAVAAQEGNSNLLNILLKLGAQLQPGSASSKRAIATPLQCAASFSDVHVLQHILDNGADLNFCHLDNTKSSSYVQDAKSMRYLEMSNLGRYPVLPRPIQLGSLGRTALQAALLGNKLDNALFLLNQGAVLVGDELSMAIRTGRTELIQQIFAKLNARENPLTTLDGHTTLQTAILSGSIGLTSHLIMLDRSCVTAEALCAATLVAHLTSNFAFIDLLLEHPVELSRPKYDVWLGSAFWLAADYGFFSLVERLLSLNLRPQRCYRGQLRIHPGLPPLCPERWFLEWKTFAAWYMHHSPQYLRPVLECSMTSGNLEFVNLLLHYGYTPTAMSLNFTLGRPSLAMFHRLHGLGLRLGERQLTGSIHSGDTTTTDWLLGLGINPNDRANEVESFELSGSWLPMMPIQSAAFRGHFEMVEKLVEHGADVNAPPYGDGGATCIQWAAMRGTFGIVQKLLRIGADPNAPACDLRGRTALEGAAEQGRLDILQLLLDSGVQTQGRGRRQYVRAVRFALREGHYAAAALLKSHRPWTEVDDEIASERKLLHDDQSPRAIAKRRTRVYESGYNSYDESTEDSDSDSSGDFYSDDECRSGLRDDVEEFQRPPISLDEEDKGDEAECIDYTFLDGSSRSSKSFEEIDVGFLPSKIYDQVKIDLRQEQSCMEDSGNELWAEAYERFSLREFGLPSFD